MAGSECRVVGFTGTRRGRTEAQRRVVRIVLARLRRYDGFEELRHGDCVGSDEETHEDACYLGYRVVLHPPTNTRFRAWCLDSCFRALEPQPYLTRDRAIVDVSDFVLATPGEALEQPRGGTWYTYRYAAQVGRARMVVLPDGSVRTAGAVPASVGYLARGEELRG